MNISTEFSEEMANNEEESLEKLRQIIWQAKPY
jgi:hypothetical protein